MERGASLNAFVRAMLAGPESREVAVRPLGPPESGPAFRLWMLMRQLAGARTESALVPLRGTPAYDHWRATLVELARPPPPAQPQRRAGRDRRMRLLASV